MWNKEWGGLPSEEFLSSLSPHLAGIRDKLYSETYTAGAKVGCLCPEWAGRLGLPDGIAVSAGAFDAHMGAAGAGIAPGTLVKIMGTSSCDMMVSRELDVQIEGICGQVDGSILPGMTGLEAGQSAVGDIFAWYRDQMRWPIENLLPQSSIRKSVEGRALSSLMEEAKGLFFREITERAARLCPGESGLMALDWLNGNRTVLVDPNLTGMIVGLTLGTRPEEIFAALVESTAYGARVIIERFEEYGVKVDKIVACGGLAEKNPFLMQTYADVTGRSIRISRSAQTCALGAAMFGAVAGGCFSSAEDAQVRMSGLKDTIYTPIPRNMEIYNSLFALYRRLHGSFGTRDDSGSLFPVMKKLLDIKRSALA
jgi:L-ribulokinase